MDDNEPNMDSLTYWGFNWANVTIVAALVLLFGLPAFFGSLFLIVFGPSSVKLLGVICLLTSTLNGAVLVPVVKEELEPMWDRRRFRRMCRDSHMGRGVTR